MRQPLPNRRPSLTRAVDINGHPGTVTIGFDPATGEPKEIFVDGPKEGSDLRHLLSDIFVLISRQLQEGAIITDMRKSLGTVPDMRGGTRPASVIGVILAAVEEASCL